jgi:hypothetical protein
MSYSKSRVIATFVFAIFFSAVTFAQVVNPTAVATTKVVLNSATWSDLGVGPALIGASGHVVFLVDDVTPTTGLQQGLSFPLNGGTQCINTISHVWAMAADAYPAIIFVAPVTGC